MSEDANVVNLVPSAKVVILGIHIEWFRATLVRIVGEKHGPNVILRIPCDTRRDFEKITFCLGSSSFDSIWGRCCLARPIIFSIEHEPFGRGL